MRGQLIGCPIYRKLTTLRFTLSNMKIFFLSVLRFWSFGLLVFLSDTFEYGVIELVNLACEDSQGYFHLLCVFGCDFFSIAVRVSPTLHIYIESMSDYKEDEELDDFIVSDEEVPSPLKKRRLKRLSKIESRSYNLCARVNESFTSKVLREHISVLVGRHWEVHHFFWGRTI